MINTTNNNNKNNKNNNKKKQQLQKNKLQKKKQQTGGENKGEIITYNILDYVFTSSSIHTMGLDWTNPLIYLFPLLQDGTSAFGQIVDTTIIGVVIYQVIYNFVFPLLQLVSNRISYIKTASTLSPHEIFSVLITGFKDSEEKKNIIMHKPLFELIIKYIYYKIYYLCIKQILKKSCSLWGNTRPKHFKLPISGLPISGPPTPIPVPPKPIPPMPIPTVPNTPGPTIPTHLPHTNQHQPNKIQQF